MKRLFRIVFILLFPFYVSSKSSLLYPSFNSSLVVTDSIQNFRIAPQFLINSYLDNNSNFFNTNDFGNEDLYCLVIRSNNLELWFSKC